MQGGLSIQAKDECYVSADYNSGTIARDKTQNNRSGSNDYWIVKFCDSTFTPNLPQSEITNPQFEILISPNPTTSLLTLRAGETKIESVAVYNMLGEEMQRAVQPQTLNFKHETTIDISQLPSGIYIVQATSGEKVWRGKVVKE